ncbi:MAG: SRPBCC domain-containing protein [Ginsengibacter sp.]
MKHEPFVIGRTYDVPVEKVWKAITDKNQMKEWYFDFSAFKPEIGFEFQFTGQNEGKTFLHLSITDVEINKKLKYSWRYDGYEGISFVTFDLYPDGNGTRLKLTHEGLEIFPAIKDFAKENFAGGRTYLIGSLLKDFVENKDAA